MQIDPGNPTPIFQQIVVRITAAVAAGTYKPGELVPSVRQSDLAVVKINADHLIAAKWGNSDDLDRGDWVRARRAARLPLPQIAQSGYPVRMRVVPAVV